MDGKLEPVTVEIYGQTYNVRGEGDPAYLTDLAQFVDRRMREIASQLSTLDPLKIAILAALNLADELHVSEREKKEAAGIWMEKAEQLANALDGTLRTAGGRH
jgi:cell division protein ZapA